jgi:hypothetical protein
MLRAPACTWIYDERKRQYRGKDKVIDRIAGQLITELLTLLKRDQERIAHAEEEMLNAPDLHDPALHRRIALESISLQHERGWVQWNNFLHISSAFHVIPLLSVWE